MQVDVIRWLDTGMAVAEGWKSPDYYASQAKTARMEVISVGLLVYEDDDVVVLCTSYDREHDAYVNGQVIAKAGILTRGTMAWDGDVRLITGLPAIQEAA
jgi:hypothetical protein